MVLRKFSWRLAAAVAGGALLGGCTSAAVQLPTLAEYDPYDEMFPGTDTDYIGLPSKFYKHPNAINIETLYHNAENAIQTGADKPERVRNAVQNELLRRSEQACTAFQARLVNGYVIGDASVKASTAMFGFLQTLTAPVQLLNTAATGVQGGVTAGLSGDILKWKAFEDANKRVHMARRHLRNEIRNAQGKKVDEYNISQAIYDAERYHSHCSIAAAYVVGEDWVPKNGHEQIVPQKGTGAPTPPKQNSPPANDPQKGT